MTVKLTSLSHGAGCGCKLPAAELEAVVRGLERPSDPNLLVGPHTADDAGVYRLSDDLALVQTVDFFTPIVDDPFLFGRIAATNAISDVYAMGGTPLTALNLVAFSLEALGRDVLREILHGGGAAAAEAGVTVLGGHSIDDAEPKYGMAITGTVHPGHVLTNAGAQAGDALVLTKPLGAGAITTGVKRGLADQAALDAAVAVMVELNRDGAAAARAARAHALTDVTGFGLLGHVHELATASGLAAEISAAAVPAIRGALELLADERAVSGGSARNREWADTFTDWEDGLDPARARLLHDAMTSGGLLAAVDPDLADGMPGSTIGRLREGPPGTISVRA